MKGRIFLLGLSVLFYIISCVDSDNTTSIVDYGIDPDTREDVSVAVQRLINDLQSRTDTRPIHVIFPKGTYHFYADNSFVRQYHASHHGQHNPKKVRVSIDHLKQQTNDRKG